TDRSTTAYGTITKWNWNFGDETTANDNSELPNPTWKYSTAGLKKVECTIENSIGCSKKIVVQDVAVVDRPPIGLRFRDTLICSVDTLRLSADGIGLFSWTPDDDNISLFNNTPQPEVF